MCQIYWGTSLTCADFPPVHLLPCRISLNAVFGAFVPSFSPISHLCYPLIMSCVSHWTNPRECWGDKRTELHLNWKKCTRAARPAAPNHVLRKSCKRERKRGREIKVLCRGAGSLAIRSEKDMLASLVMLFLLKYILNPKHCFFSPSQPPSLIQTDRGKVGADLSHSVSEVTPCYIRRVLTQKVRKMAEDIVLFKLNYM